MCVRVVGECQVVAGRAEKRYHHWLTSFVVIICIYNIPFSERAFGMKVQTEPEKLFP